MTIRLDVVTVERAVFSDDVDMITAPGAEGELGILPHHANLMTTLKAGDLVVKKSGEELDIAIGGGFLEVRGDRIIILADSAERAEEIDIARAEAARRRAQEKLSQPGSKSDQAATEAALRRALARIQAADRIRKRRQKQL